ncbi:MAG: ankyrin repeat protein, partial [Gemmatimonadetes bacterium]|nr:ankyrin repeat protein [Gemmatimonadota bacterium]
MRKAVRATMLATIGMVALLGAGVPDAPIADAAMRGDIESVRALLKQGAEVNAAQGDGMTALHWAAEQGNAEM